MNEEDFKDAFKQRIPLLNAMGEYVKNVVLKGINEFSSIGVPQNFLKMNPEYRVKDVESFISKIFRKGKNYKDPLNDITDQVGIRFVVLYYEDIEVIGKIVESHPNWEYSLDRDIEEEKKADPHHFSYQSKHYVVHPKDEIHTNGENLTKNIKCEIQIRTLLQHAYAELAHDTTYKPSQEASPIVKRSVAKTSALIETTDSIFMEVRNTLEEQKKPVIRIMRICKDAYEKYIDEPIIFESKLREQIILPYLDMMKDLESSSLDAFIESNRVIITKIKENRIFSILFKCAEVLILYYLVRTERFEVRQHWEHDIALLDIIYADLGINPN